MNVTPRNQNRRICHHSRITPTPAELSLGFGVYDGRRLFAEERERFIF
jgi:hypothetical protein